MSVIPRHRKDPVLTESFFCILSISESSIPIGRVLRESVFKRRRIVNVQFFFVSGNLILRVEIRFLIRIDEKTDSALADSLRMHYYVDDEGCLDIQFCKSGCYSIERLKSINYNKRLTIEVPRGMVLNEIDMSLVSASVNIDSVVCRELTVDGVAFDIMADLPKALPNEIDMEGVDCSLSMCVPHEAGMTIEMSGVKKYLNSQLPTRKEGKKTIIGDGACEIDIEGVNCTLNINK